MHRLGVGWTINVEKQQLKVVSFRAIKDNSNNITGCVVICRQPNGKIVEIDNKAVEEVV